MSSVTLRAADESALIALAPVEEYAVARPALFQLYKTTLHEFIHQTFGWDETFQQTRFNTAYLDKEILSVVLGSTSIGYVVLASDSDALHLSLLLIDPAYQMRGYGKQVVQKLLSRARHTSQRLTLSCFRCNTRATGFYLSLGFTITNEDEHFSMLASSPLP